MAATAQAKVPEDAGAAGQAPANTNTNLLSVVRLTRVEPPPLPALYSETCAQMDAFRQTATAFKPFGLEHKWAPLGQEAATTASKWIQDCRAALFTEQGALPADLVFQPAFFTDTLELYRYDRAYQEKKRGNRGPDWMSYMARTPRAQLSDLRQLATELGFIIMPYDYLSQRAISGESEAVRRQISRFCDASKDVGFTVYVLAPPAYYGVKEHAESADPNIRCFDGKHSIMMGVTRQTVHAIRTVLGTLRGLEGKIDDARTRITRAEQDMVGIQQQVNDQNDQIRQIQRDLLATRFDIGKMESRLDARIDGVGQIAGDAASAAAAALAVATETHRMVLCMLDPLMFAVPKKIGLDGETAAYLGPCWGPDFPLIMAKAYVNGAFDPGRQGADLTQTMAGLWG